MATGEATWRMFPPELRRAAEDGGYCPTCDLGGCERETAGWAFDRQFLEWLPGCEACLRRAVIATASVVFIADIEACFAAIDVAASREESGDGR